MPRRTVLALQVSGLLAIASLAGCSGAASPAVAPSRTTTMPTVPAQPTPASEGPVSSAPRSTPTGSAFQVWPAEIFMALPPGWRSGLQPNASDEAIASVRDDPECLSVGHDSTRVGEGDPGETYMVPFVRVQSKGVPEPGDDFAVWLAGMEAVFRDAMADPASASVVRALERVKLPAGEAIRVELVTGPEPATPFEIAQVQYYVPTEVGFFGVWFGCAADELPDYRATFDQMARTFLRTDLHPEDYIEQFLLAVTK